LDKAPDAFRTISEVAEELDVPQHVLRFWETRFSQIRPMKRGGGRRYYRPDDLDLLRGIRHLLYGEGYTIRGVQRILREQGVKFVQSVWQAGAAQPARVPADEAEDGEEMEAAEPQAGRAARALFGLLPVRRASEPAEPPEEEPEIPPQRGPRIEPKIEPKIDPRIDPRIELPPVASLRADPPVLYPDEQAAPARAPISSAPAPAASTGLAREDLRKLQASLHELSECRRLLDAVLDEQG
jgi:DNA-binding transcriptional MerR regulator